MLRLVLANILLAHQILTCFHNGCNTRLFYNSCSLCIVHIWMFIKCGEICKLNLNLFYWLLMYRWHAILQSLVWLVVSYKGKRAITPQPLTENSEPLKAPQRAKSAQNSPFNTVINTDVHAQTWPASMYLNAPRDTGFLFFPLCLLFWLKSVQIAYGLRSSPSWWPSSFGDQSPQQLQAQKLNKFQNYTIILGLSIIQIRTRCIKTVVTRLLFFIISGKMWPSWGVWWPTALYWSLWMSVASE